MTDQLEAANGDPEITSSDRPRRSDGVFQDAVAILGTYLALGVLCGLAWWLLVEPAMFTKLKGGGSMNEVELGKRFDADAWYAVIAALTGLISGGVISWWRSRDLMVTTVLLLIGAGIAATVMTVTGQMLGPGNPEAALAAAKVGEQVAVQLQVTARATYLVWPISVLIGGLVVLWSPPRDQSSSGT